MARERKITITEEEEEMNDWIQKKVATTIKTTKASVATTLKTCFCKSSYMHGPTSRKGKKPI